MFIPKKINVKKPGDPILASDFNALISRIERLEKLEVGIPLQIIDFQSNASIQLSDYTLCRRFELIENMDRGDRADAQEIFNDSYGNLTQDSNTTFKVYDPFNILAANIYDRELAIKRPDSDDDWEIVRLQHIAYWIYFRTKQPFTMADASFPVDVIEYWDGYSPEAANAQGESSSSSGDGNVIVYNLAHRPPTTYEFSGSDNIVGYANYDMYKRHYRVIQLQCG